VVLCSSDSEELVRLCDRVLVLRDGRVVSEVPRESLSEARLVRAEVGDDQGSQAGEQVEAETEQGGE
jgi:ABC-type sugar transport system ATPase subunit